ncbi:YbaB/EbfC family nucleoid-associated protein [Nocardia puris]|nr:YbaB/EbfC family nucleoid-associated protein [Nocardia puris]MBF6211559.1 YbaB/EbfC family nucleoid-associated protein [Nocardia puris]MBF6366811.1 YbaB/EbfC family nucleoid-associated protein [Nocardia puris]MBF6461152.1 YbaB/EbfC family nucleoid-associated protein [Nocardia puris]
MASVIDAFQHQMRAIAQAQRQRVKLTASATSRDKRVTVTVNANGVVIETKFSAGISELSYGEIAATVTRTAQEAAEEVARLSRELAAPLAERRARLPKLSEVIEGMPDFESEIPTEPPVSTAPPGAPERTEADEPEMTFSDVEEIDHDRPAKPGPGVVDSSW